MPRTKKNPDAPTFDFKMNPEKELAKTVAKQVKKCVQEQTEEQYYCESNMRCKGGPFPRDQVYYDPVDKVSVCKKCWGGAELPPGCS